MGIIESAAASFAQSKGAEKIVAGIRGSEIGIGTGKEMGEVMGTGDLNDSDSEMVGIGGSVCVDIVTEMGLGVEGGFD